MTEKTWFKASLGEAEVLKNENVGMGFLFGETMPRDTFEDVGINLRVLEPRQPASLYHSENAEEFFIVLGGEALAIVEDEEVPLRKWDYLFCPPKTPHVIVGGGGGPCHVLMVGGRGDPDPPHYPVSEAAGRYGASVKTEMSGGAEAWEQVGWTLDFERVPLPWPPAD